MEENGIKNGGFAQPAPIQVSLVPIAIGIGLIEIIGELTWAVNLKQTKNYEKEGQN